MTDVVVQDKDVIIEVEQPTVPPSAPPPKIGLVEINQVVQRGTAWITGQGPPTQPGAQYGDMYLDADTGDMYQWNGAEWIFQGTFAPSTDTPEEVLAKLITVDGAGSGLDADLLDGNDSTYFATAAALSANNARDDTQDSQITIINGKADDNANDIALQATHDVQQDNRLTAIEAKDVTQDGRLTAVESKNTAQDTAISGKEPAIAAGNPSYFWAGDKTWKPTPPSGISDAPNDGKQYARQSLNWAQITVPPGTIISDTTPASPAAGQMWLKSDTGVLYIWYADPNSSQWIQVSASPQSAAPATITPNRGYIDPDLHLLNDTTDATNDIVFPSGVVASEVFPYPLMQHTQTIRQVDVVFDTNNSDRFGGRFSSAAVSDGTWHCFFISNGTTTKSGFSKNANPTADDLYPAGYTHYRRVASWLRESGVMIPLRQEGDHFWRLSAKGDYSLTSARAAALWTCSVPVGIKTYPIITTSVSVVAASSNATVMMGSGDAPTAPPVLIVAYVFTSSQINVASVDAGVIPPVFRTNLLAQIWLRVDVAGSVNGIALTNFGWIDKRGKA